VKYAFITQHKKTWPVDLMCRLLGVSRNAYYRYCVYQQHRQTDPEHEGMLAAVKEIAESCDYSYGSRRM
jgi:putative transposase